MILILRKTQEFRHNIQFCSVWNNLEGTLTFLHNDTSDVTYRNFNCTWDFIEPLKFVSLAKLRDLKHLLLTLSQEESVFMRQLFVSPGLKWHNNCSQYKFLSHFSCWLKLKIMQYFLLKSLQFNTTGCTGDNDKNINILHLSCLCNCLRMYQHDQNVIVQECYLIFSISVESLFNVSEFFLSQRKVCCRKEMHPQWDRGRSGRQIYPQATEREIMPGGDPEGGGDARAWTRAPETGRSQGGVRDTQWARTHNWVVSVNANSNLSRFLNLNYLYINLHYCTNLVTRANYNLMLITK